MSSQIHCSSQISNDGGGGGTSEQHWGGRVSAVNYILSSCTTTRRLEPLEYYCFTMLLLVYNKVTPPYLYMYPSLSLPFPQPPSHSSTQVIRERRAELSVLHISSTLAICFIDGSVFMLILVSPIRPHPSLPHGVHKSLPYVCVNGHHRKSTERFQRALCVFLHPQCHVGRNSLSNKNHIHHSQRTASTRSPVSTDSHALTPSCVFSPPTPTQRNRFQWKFFLFLVYSAWHLTCTILGSSEHMPYLSL